MALAPDQIERMTEQLRGQLVAGVVSIEAGFAAFPAGRELLDYVQDLRAALNGSEVEQ